MLTSTEIFKSLHDVVQPYAAVLLDAYGVFWGGNACGLLPNAAEAMEKLVKKGKIVGILSNSTQLSQKEIDKVSKAGLTLGKHFHFYITSGDVAKNIFLKPHQHIPFLTPKRKFYVFAGKSHHFNSYKDIFADSEFQETQSLEEADFIYLNVPHINDCNQLDPFAFKSEIEELIASKLPVICANPDKYAQEGNPPTLYVRQGSIAQYFENVYYIGKPYHQIFTTALQELKNFDIHSPSSILMVGDTPETDIAGANKQGLHSALIVNEGVMKERISNMGLDSAISHLSISELPTYFIEKL